MDEEEEANAFELLDVSCIRMSIIQSKWSKGQLQVHKT